MQQDLIMFNIEDALRLCIQAAGGIKEVGSHLYPEKSIDAAGRYLNDCLNTEKREKLSLEQIILIARLGKKQGCNALMEFLSSELGYEKPKPINLETEKEKLQREFINAQKQMAELMNQMHDLTKLQT
ncbi:MAG: hypothetical protein SVC26_09865 [Pseudomonadota bacterium]|nr:hypothetical protein [Pseudomonadota bacterium]